MTTAWTRALIAGVFVLPLGCEVKVNDGPIDGDGGSSFSGNSSSQGGSGGSSSGSGGNAGQGGSGTGGSSGSGGSGGSDVFPAPTCSVDTNDDDECIQCLKQECCTAWLACDDFGCDSEWNNVAACVDEVNTEVGVADDEDFRVCVSENTADDSMLPQANTVTLLDCINEVPTSDAGIGTNCGVPCFGTDIFFE
jgi:hypothetical protein